MTTPILPEELVVKILVEYHGGFSYRKGKFMQRIQSDDERFQIVMGVIPHPNMYLLSEGRVSVKLQITEIKYYRLRLYFTEGEDRREPITSITLWKQCPGLLIYNPTHL